MVRRRSKAEQLLLDPQKRVSNTTPEAPTTNSLSPPERFNNTPDKLDIWNNITSDLARRSLLSESYYDTLVILVDNIYLLETYRPALEESGPIVPVFDKTGVNILKYEANPLYMIINRIERTILQIGNRLGMNPRDSVYLSNPDIKTIVSDTNNNGNTEVKKINYFT